MFGIWLGVAVAHVSERVAHGINDIEIETDYRVCAAYRIVLYRLGRLDQTHISYRIGFVCSFRMIV